MTIGGCFFLLSRLIKLAFIPNSTRTVYRHNPLSLSKSISPSQYFPFHLFVFAGESVCLCFKVQQTLKYDLLFSGTD